MIFTFINLSAKVNIYFISTNIFGKKNCFLSVIMSNNIFKKAKFILIIVLSPFEGVYKG